MSEYLVRAYASELEVQGDGRTIFGLLAPYNEVAEVDDGFGPYYETFLPGCFERPLRASARYLRLQLEHNGHWVGRGEAWMDSSRGLEAELRLDNTEAGREAAFKVADDQTPGLSIAFQPGQYEKRRHPDGKWVVERAKVKTIHHVALCQEPAYRTARVEAVRSKPDPTPQRIEYWKEWTERVRRV